MFSEIPNRHGRIPLAEQPAFWCTVIAIIIFIGGVGIGIRIATAGIRESLVSQQTKTHSSPTPVYASEGEIVGVVQSAGDQLEVVRGDETITFAVATETEVYSYDSQAPLLPGENREKIGLDQDSIQPGDTVVIQYLTQADTDTLLALSIQRIH